MKELLHCIFVFLVFLSYSCEKQYTFAELHAIPESGWTYDNILKYEFEVKDTTELYDLYLEIDYLTSFSFQNVYVNVYTGLNQNEMKSTELSLDLSNNLGIWKGDCNADQCTYLLPLQKSIFFEKPGKQYFWLEQHSRTEELKGIQSIRFVGDVVGVKK